MTTPNRMVVWNSSMPLEQIDADKMCYEPGQRHYIGEQQDDDSLGPSDMHKLVKWLQRKYDSDMTLCEALVAAVKEYET
jgi:hypothetical protein